MPSTTFDQKHTPDTCSKSIMAVKDALYAVNGKWKLPIIIALNTRPMRFKELQRSVSGITPKVLTKELRDMELNDLVYRKVYPTIPVTVEYGLTSYSKTLGKVINELADWGLKHRKRMFARPATITKSRVS